MQFYHEYCSIKSFNNYCSNKYPSCTINNETRSINIIYTLWNNNLARHPHKKKDTKIVKEKPQIFCFIVNDFERQQVDETLEFESKLLKKPLQHLVPWNMRAFLFNQIL